MFKQIIVMFLAFFILAMLTGCATIIRGTSQEIPITSNPSGASVKINGMPKGNTPVTVMLPRGNNQFVRIEASGYAPYEILLESYFRPYAMTNLILLPFALPGVIVDKVNRADWTYTPEFINANLTPLGKENVAPVQ